MATLLRSRRFADRAAEATHQYITFQLRQYRFALPIQNLTRVSLVQEASEAVADLSAPDQAQDEVRWIDVDQSLFGTVDTPTASATDGINPPQKSCVILFRDDAGHTVGLAIDTQPKMQRIAQSQIVPLLEAKTHPTHLQAVCSSMIQMDGEGTVFLLDLGKLCTL